jgi:glycogen synthase
VGEVVILSLSHIPGDGRILRHAAALASAGATLTLIGARSADGSEGVLPRALPARHITVAIEPWTARRVAHVALRAVIERPLLTPARARRLVRKLPGIEALAAALHARLSERSNATPKLILCNDWMTLPATLEAHERCGVPFHYDTHELATSEHEMRWSWRFTFPPLIRHIEAAGIARARTTSCVSPGIAAEMTRAYRLRTAPAVIRNLPDGVPLKPGPIGAPVQVLYHGLFKPDRGLIHLARGVTDWPEGYRLVLRGHAPNPAFGEHLTAITRRPAVRDRIAIEQAVPQSCVITAANRSDIGIFLPSLTTRQNRYALPNKLFEYLHAGLMVIVPAGTDMGELVEQHGVGLTIADADARRLPRLLADLSHARITAFKAAAACVARKLTWGNEAAALLSLLGGEWRSDSGAIAS